jgi:hypothetical protein
VRRHPRRCCCGAYSRAQLGGLREFTVTADGPIDRADAKPPSLLLWCGFSRAARRAARVHRHRLALRATRSFCCCQAGPRPAASNSRHRQSFPCGSGWF